MKCSDFDKHIWHILHNANMLVLSEIWYSFSEQVNTGVSFQNAWATSLMKMNLSTPTPTQCPAKRNISIPCGKKPAINPSQSKIRRPCGREINVAVKDVVWISGNHLDRWKTEPENLHNVCFNLTHLSSLLKTMLPNNPGEVNQTKCTCDQLHTPLSLKFSLSVKFTPCLICEHVCGSKCSFVKWFPKTTNVRSSDSFLQNVRLVQPSWDACVRKRYAVFQGYKI